MADKKQKLVLSILDFLNTSIADGTVKKDDVEGLEVAAQCIGEAFGVDPSDSAQVERLSVKPATLQSIFDVFLKTRERVGADPTASTSSTPAPPSAPAAPSAEDKAAAEKLKAEGNAHMTAKRHAEAIDSYTRAIARDPTSVVYYSNRAAAHISLGDHASAASDAERAIELDPKFVRAYSRLGHAQYSLGEYAAAAEAYRRGLEVDPNNANMKNDLAAAQARIPAEDVTGTGDIEEVSSRSPPAAGGADPFAGLGGMGGMADMLRGMGGGGGGGMPDFASMMNNPQLMAAAQSMMANGGMERLMSNPTVANMMNRMQNGGGMPDMSEIMADPSLRDMASQFGMGGGAGGAGGRQ